MKGGRVKIERGVALQKQKLDRFRKMGELGKKCFPMARFPFLKFKTWHNRRAHQGPVGVTLDPTSLPGTPWDKDLGFFATIQTIPQLCQAPRTRRFQNQKVDRSALVKVVNLVRWDPVEPRFFPRTQEVIYGCARTVGASLELG